MKRLLFVLIVLLNLSESEFYPPIMYPYMMPYPMMYPPTTYDYQPVEQYFRNTNNRKLAEAKPKLFTVKPTVVGNEFLLIYF